MSPPDPLQLRVLLTATALAMTEERLAATPVGPVRAMLGSIRNQLLLLTDAAATHRPLTPVERTSLNLHVIAVREFESTDPGYCDAICDAVTTALGRR